MKLPAMRGDSDREIDAAIKRRHHARLPVNVNALREGGVRASPARIARRIEALLGGPTYAQRPKPMSDAERQSIARDERRREREELAAALNWALRKLSAEERAEAHKRWSRIRKFVR